MGYETLVHSGRQSNRLIAVGIALALSPGCQPTRAPPVAGPTSAQGMPAGSAAWQEVDLAALARRGELRVPNRQVAELSEGVRSGVRVSAAPAEPAIWLPGLNFATGSIELDVRGKDRQGESFVGIAFGGGNDSTFEAVYLRPFNFAATDPVRRAHSVQYIHPPTHTWSALRSERPGAYENSVDPVPDPNDWVQLRIIVEESRVRVYVSDGSEPDLVVDRLSDGAGKQVGLWVGYNSEGEFANLRLTPERSTRAGSAPAVGQAPMAAPGSSALQKVNIGYGALPRRAVAGAVSSATAEEMEARTAGRVEELLMDRFPGVDVRRLPNGEFSIRIRGSRSFMAGDEPLVVIDGVPSPLGLRNPLSDLAPQNIARIDILKDAGSTAAYGSRGANGVILITTKRGL